MTWGRVALPNSSLLLYGWVRISLNPIPDTLGGFLRYYIQSFCRAIRGGGPREARTLDFYLARVTLSQLSYRPINGSVF